ncbi:MAG: S-adenosylmethionine synthetase [Thermofilum sp. ex4484_82]|nr:MAG: S-adenosylmethionine synthetase [Thermofilum sp. ex4484_82]OYT37897.1 MAG: S-adenosylmethionine synthetase [Archaeoglobales archaeon ex4484_92]
MASSIVVNKLERTSIEEYPMEFVERKGKGHPDFIADSIAEISSIGLSKYYLEHYGRILHHNVDKVLVVGGQAAPRFGGGEVLQPIYILISGRATTDVKLENGTIENIPIGPILLGEAKKWIMENFRFLNPEKHVIIDYKVGKGSADLVHVFEREKEFPHANDTSLGVGYAPLTETEKLVLKVEEVLNSEDVKKQYPAIGEDIKVMAVRQNNKIDLTVAAAIISKFIHNIDEYIAVKEEVEEIVHKVAEKITDKEVKVYVNTADNESTGKEESIYLVVTGTSAEHGDDGQTGRGNRANGLITPMRPMSLEATAGKNPVNHVGKLYNVIANLAAKKIAKIEGVKEAYVILLSQIGKPINEPLRASIDLILEEGVSFNSVKYEAQQILSEDLNNVRKITQEILDGKIRLY